ncbi:MAG: F0F1 ATP synthase subunit epsilon [Cyanobacteriota bacterium]|nr:F0F1 ATP synthase subunit epsilon [Cyanobacteriota bacterium]
MNLKILLPTKILLDREVTKITAEAANGSFGLLPEHIDFVAALVPGILSYESDTGQETFLAVDEGILVKRGAEVFVSVRQAVGGTDLDSLQQTVEQAFKTLDERERKTRSAIAKLEVGIARGILEIGGTFHEAR